MNKRNAVLDASFWINAHYAEVVDYLPDYFNLFVPTQVIQEVEYTPPDIDQLTSAGESFRSWRQAGQFKCQDPARPVDWFHAGENAAIGLAQEQGCVLLIDDQAPYHLAKARGLRAIASVDFIVLLYADNRLSHNEARARLAKSRPASHLKRAATVALAVLARQRGDRDVNLVS